MDKFYGEDYGIEDASDSEPICGGGEGAAEMPAWRMG